VTARIDSLWAAHFSPRKDWQPGNILGQIIASHRSVFPKMSRQEFDRQFGQTLDESFRRFSSSEISGMLCKTAESGKSSAFRIEMTAF
jgi:hypothetical protein